MKTIESQSAGIVRLEVRRYRGQDALFTSDGKLLANQVLDTGHTYNHTRIEHGNTVRDKVFRASFLMDDDNVSQQGPYEDC